MGIRERQNCQRSQERLAAQRWLYRQVKKVEGVRLVGVVAVAGFALWGLTREAESYGHVATVLVVLLWFVDQPVLVRWADRMKEEAAAIQEAFDCFVLDLPWSDHSGVEQPTDDRVKELARRKGARSDSPDELADWYRAEAIPVEPVAARLHCQRASCRWDERLRREWIRVVKSVVGASVVMVLVGSVLAEVSLLNVVLAAAAGLRLIAWVVLEVSAQSSARKRIEKLHRFLSRAGEQTGRQTLCDVWLVQARLFEHRRLSPVVPEWFYKLRKPVYEAAERG